MTIARLIVISSVGLVLWAQSPPSRVNPMTGKPDYYGSLPWSSDPTGATCPPGSLITYNGALYVSAGGICTPNSAPASAGVGTWNGRTADVLPLDGDYTAAKIVVTPAGNISSTRVSTALNELDTEKQAALGYTPLNPANNLSDVANAATARTSLGLGTGDSPTWTGGTFTGLLDGCITTVSGVLTSTASPCGSGGGSFTVASEAEVLAGTNNTNGITPARLRYGLINWPIQGYTCDTSGCTFDGTSIGELQDNNVWTGHQTYTPSSTQTLTASDTINPNGPVVLIACSPADLTFVSTPTITTSGVGNGRFLKVGVTGTNKCTLQDKGTLTNSALCLSGTTQTLDPADGKLSSLDFWYSTTRSCWVQVGGATSAAGGGGDASTDTTSTSVGQAVVFVDTTGKLLGEFTSSGYCKYLTGVPTCASTIPIGDLSVASGAKGDLVVHNGTTFVRLPVGSNGQVVTADSAQTEGVKWSTTTGLTEACYAPGTSTNSTSDDALATVAIESITAGEQIRVTALYTATGTVAGKSVRVQLGSVWLGDAFNSGSPTTLMSRLSGEISILDSSNVAGIWTLWSANGTAQNSGISTSTGINGRSTIATGTVTGTLDLNVYGKVGNASDTLTLRHLCIVRTAPTSP